MKKFYSLVAVAAFTSFGVAQAQDVIFNETFDTYEGEGGNDGGWSGGLNQPAIADGVDEATGFEYLKAYQADGAVKIGTGKAQGFATTPKLAGLNGNAKLTFRAGAWNSTSEQTTLLLEITGGGTLSVSEVELTKGAFNDFSVDIIGGTSETKITFKGFQPASARFMLDDVKVEESLATIDYSEAAKAVSNTLWTNTASFNVKEKSVVEVYNMNGQLVKSFEVKGVQTVDVSSLAKGIYIVKTTSNGKTATQKVVKK
ncbi:T9SS type A sorting domain-containing protein [Empedobacter sp. 225-1]|uniref:T9SS type A sorting domain-containing protein n=1 Tax=Empedobacter TaxID=59734 RepID=UPI001CE14EDC|nr:MULTISPECIES: T9SS type A sorting domain-containing protein [Empedobacter]MCA4776584.1 T9SS type A sorting domain-containing protein [Empedobacter stercoris]MDM1523474.1 T9SS type A sorting domain-containing protein [Empedobacter sp. 225-1]MDM1543416.1 T9SS type A sorting domain-containing protein [Empedobacter sp. 189-2]